MKKILIVFIVVTCFFYSSSISAQKLASDFYRLEFYIEDNQIGFYDTPIDYHKNERFNSYLSNLKGYLMYLSANYSDVPKMYLEFEQLLPDTNAIKVKFKNLIDNDKQFNIILQNSFNKKTIPPLHIDSLLYKVSRFYYVHIFQDVLAAHFCVGINGLFEQKKSEFDPYYNAFAFNCIYNDFGTEKFSEYLNEIGDKINKKTSEDVAKELREKVYKKVINDNEMKKHLISEYESKKEFLNFKLIY